MKMNVLSIDWDYFINAKKGERALLFPDGGNEGLSEYLRHYVWTMRYADTAVQKERNMIERSIEDIGVREEALSLVKYCMYNISDGTQIGFADSHAQIYSLLANNTIPIKQYNIYNIDHHSDCYNIGDELNCGNWVNKLDSENYINNYIWIGNEDSDNEDIKSALNCKCKRTTDLGVIKNITWDYIFICRSGVWSPPHLDVRFNEFYSFMLYELGLSFNKDFFIDRYEPMVKDIQDYKAVSIKQMEIIDKYRNSDCSDELKVLKEIFQ